MKTHNVKILDDSDFEVVIYDELGMLIGRFACADGGCIYIKYHSPTDKLTEIELNDEGDLVSFVSS